MSTNHCSSKNRWGKHCYYVRSIKTFIPSRPWYTFGLDIFAARFAFISPIHGANGNCSNTPTLIQCKEPERA